MVSGLIDPKLRTYNLHSTSVATPGINQNTGFKNGDFIKWD